MIKFYGNNHPQGERVSFSSHFTFQVQSLVMKKEGSRNFRQLFLPHPQSESRGVNSPCCFLLDSRGPLPRQWSCPQLRWVIPSWSASQDRQECPRPISQVILDPVTLKLNINNQGYQTAPWVTWIHATNAWWPKYNTQKPGKDSKVLTETEPTIREPAWV